MQSKNLSRLLFVLAGALCFFEARIILPLNGKIAFCYFGVICVFGILFRWSALIPTTLLTFFFGQNLPYKNGYAHNPMESVQHDLIFPTVLAGLVAALMIGCGRLVSGKQTLPVNDGVGS